MQYVILFILFVGIFIAAPILLIAYSITAPLYLQVMLLIWIIVLMLSFILSKKFSTSIGISIVSSIIFGLCFASWYAEEVLHGDFNDGGLGDTIGVFSAIFFSAIPICLLATVVRAKIDAARKEKEQMRIDKIKQEIYELKKAINSLENQLNNKQTIINLLHLIEFCGADVSNIENNPEISNIRLLTDEIAQNNCQIKELSDKLKIYKRIAKKDV